MSFNNMKSHAAFLLTLAMVFAAAAIAVGQTLTRNPTRSAGFKYFQSMK